ncbi:PREDICTED: uncharacterized protein LOC108553406 [Eufriesea mexicana]|uniref:uncharacterized protein LOC108553406 n=1 Tax=Eufriesea mexicana TaxID=516756 RepID=UPI00083C6C5E|nr:PREDICTED: uncharacterized protein LOC108553406 [Eufriesea mexicana]
MKRMWIYDKLVASVISYGVEIWGWKEWEEVEKIQTKYIKWCLGLDRWTPKYIIRKKTLRNKVHTNTINRAARFEEKIETQVKKILLKKCVEEVTKGQIKRSWVKQRMKCINECGFSQEGLEELKRRGAKSRYNKRYRNRTPYTITSISTN